MDSMERGDMRFSDDSHLGQEDFSGDGPVELIVGEHAQRMYDLCSPMSFHPTLPVLPWTGECLHGFGHGAFMFAVESLAAAKKTLSVIEVLDSCGLVSNTNT